MSWRLRELTEQHERYQAAIQTQAWGFPRPISQDELDLGSWFRMGQTLIFWFEWHGGTADARLHLAVDTASTPVWPVRRWHANAVACAELMGASRLVFRPVTGDTLIVDYATRIGWRWAGDLMELPLGG